MSRQRMLGPWLLPVAAVALALASVGLGLALGWRGVDVAASVHRIDEYRAVGLALWDPTWFGGQWTLAYSVAFAPVAAALGLPLLSLVAAAAATMAWALLVRRIAWLPDGAAVAATLVFAVGNVVQTAIGQLPYLSGEALGLAALVLASGGRRSRLAALALAAGASLLSPLAGLFVAVAGAGWALAALRRGPNPGWRVAFGRILPGFAALVPVGVTALLFGGGGVMPFRAIDAVWDLVIALVLAVATPARLRPVRIGLGLYAIAIVASWAVASPVGGNIGRVEDTFALPLAVLVLWSRARAVLAVAAVPLVASAWTPAWGAMTSIPSKPASGAAFYQPLDRWLARADPHGTLGRVEVVPTHAHWEAVYVGSDVPLARGWERQTDVTDNPIFYQPGGFDAAAYRSWLLDTGVRWVALPATTLDPSGIREAQVLTSGVPGLRPVWHDRDWRVWVVLGSGGFTGPGASVVAASGDTVTLDVRRAGPLTVRVRADGDWQVSSGTGTVAPGPQGWIVLDTPRPEQVTLRVSPD